jgi:hypothetical protein
VFQQSLAMIILSAAIYELRNEMHQQLNALAGKGAIKAHNYRDMSNID